MEERSHIRCHHLHNLLQHRLSNGWPTQLGSSSRTVSQEYNSGGIFCESSVFLLKSSWLGIGRKGGPKASEKFLPGLTNIPLLYQNSAAIAGLAAGPYLFPFFTLRMGRCAVIFWTIVGLFICQIWAAVMTHHSNYTGYILSRLMAGIFGSVVGVVGPRIVVDIFFLHERGRRFAIIFTVNSFGSVVGPTLSGFISAQTSWPVEYWWTLALLGLVLISCLCVLEETGFERDDRAVSPKSWPDLPQGWAARRLATFFFGQRLQPQYSVADMACPPLHETAREIVLTQVIRVKHVLIPS